MSESTVAIIGSGIVGTTVAYLLTQQGYDVEVFEKGPEYPYPHSQQFAEEFQYLYTNPAYTLPPDLKNHTEARRLPFSLEGERFMRVGGSATQWEAIALRMMPSDFRTRSLFGYGQDWPLTYDDLEPYYSQAEEYLGVSGTVEDNPFAPPRSRPYPLPPFELSWDDQILAERLRDAGIVLHTTPQARTRALYGDRAPCMNYGVCWTCPIGARYSPTYHLLKAIDTGLCRLRTDVSVRRILHDAEGRATGLVYRPNNASEDVEHSASLIVLAAGAVESARLLLLSTSPQYPDGLGNQGGQVGRNLTFHHIWAGRFIYDIALYPGRFGGWTGQSQQFIDSETRGQHMAIKVEFPSRNLLDHNRSIEWDDLGSPEAIAEAAREHINVRPILLHAESVATPQKYLTLSEERDRFGDPFAHIVYQSSDLDYATYDFARSLASRFARGSGAIDGSLGGPDAFSSGAHHMGTCRMGTSPDDSVTNSFGQVHGIRNLFVLGGSTFVGTSGASNPTLTMVALAMRAAEFMIDQVLPPV